MKKTILSICLTLLFTPIISAFPRNYDIAILEQISFLSNSNDKEEIDIDIENIPGSTHVQSRSLIKPVECYLSQFGIELYLNVNMGDIVIQIFDETGFLIDSRKCNTLVESSIFLDKPSLSGVYLITICGSKCQGRGILII
ncbi:MAG: hypothetical protein RR555_10020 [Bacteroidales bacterium]